MSSAKKRTRKRITDPNARKIATVKFTGKTEDVREAERIFKQYLDKPDPDDPENTTKHMKPQQVLVLALNALGYLEQLQQEATPSEPGTQPEVERIDEVELSLKREISTLKAQMNATMSQGFEELQSGLNEVKKRIQGLATTGKIPQEEADQINDAIDKPITGSFMQNMIGNLKPGRTPRK